MGQQPTVPRVFSPYDHKSHSGQRPNTGQMHNFYQASALSKPRAFPCSEGKRMLIGRECDQPLSSMATQHAKAAQCTVDGPIKLARMTIRHLLV